MWQDWRLPPPRRELQPQNAKVKSVGSNVPQWWTDSTERAAAWMAALHLLKINSNISVAATTKEFGQVLCRFSTGEKSEEVKGFYTYTDILSFFDFGDTFVIRGHISPKMLDNALCGFLLLFSYQWWQKFFLRNFRAVCLQVVFMFLCPLVVKSDKCSFQKQYHNV